MQLVTPTGPFFEQFHQLVIRQMRLQQLGLQACAEILGNLCHLLALVHQFYPLCAFMLLFFDLRSFRQRLVLATAFELERQTNAVVLLFKRSHQRCLFLLAQALEVLLRQFALPLCQSPLDFCCFALGSILRLSLSLQQVFVV